MRVVFVVLVASAAFVACREPSPVVAAETRVATPTPPPPPQTAHPASATEAPSSDRITGTVLETMDAGGYTYLRLKTDGGDIWAAVRQTKVAEGKPATVVGSVWMQGFESKTLSRKFDRILFGALDASSHGAVSGHPAPSAAADLGEIQVKRAEGARGRTIAEVFAQRASLKDAPVEVRGRVVKFLPGIMGRNWLHLRDGSGSREKLDDDLTVTTAQGAAVGDVVLVSGKLGVDRDFGAGYTYTVIVEDAALSK